ncbi:NUDIX domain-containing protein [Patescibacteria group bacterium]|nr:NUDIX domain-containing protein [Patescibacteria group bacterium]MBU1951595.1 NUDIX domain-containing protein [Patescibacteria group bacterium]
MIDDNPNFPRIICSAFIEKDGKFLVVNDPKFGAWRVPGGKPEGDERLEKALEREMQEEVGVKIENPKFLGYGQDSMYLIPKKKTVSRLLMFFHVKVDQELTIDPTEASEHKWVKFEEIKNVKNIEGGLVDFFNRNPNIQL